MAGEGIGTYVTEGGLLVTDRRVRADELTAGLPPRDNPPNANVQPPPPVSVGPTTSEGFGNTHVMYPEGAVVPQAWSGWPVEWATPRWGSWAGMAEMMDRISTVWYCIDLNSGLLATMPPYRKTNGAITTPVAWMANPQPEAYNGWIEAMRQVVVSYYGGEAFLWATSRYADGSVRSWVMLNPQWISVDWVGGVRRYTLAGAHLADEGPGSDVLHIRYASWPGDARGHGPLEAAARNLISADALERYSADLAVRGGIPWAVLKAPGNITAQQATDMRESYVNARLSAMGAPAVLSGGIELQTVTISPREMALLELSQWNSSRLALLLGVPPFLAGLPSGGDPMTYSNASSIFDFHWRAFLRTKAASLMEAISQWALPRGQSVELNRDEYVRPNLGERSTAYATLFNIMDPATGERAITVDEIRAAERFDVAPGLPSSVSSVSV